LFRSCSAIAEARASQSPTRARAEGRLPAAVAALRRPGAHRWLGPAIGPGAYEVGADVRSAFVARDPKAECRFAPNARGRWQADLYGLARDSLAGAGVPAIYGGGFCTFTEAERFFSHRREGPCGRMATLVWLDSTP
jgi:copper oxidase (laccase) domain-containing protein